MKLNNARWGKGQRHRFPIAPDMIAKIRSGDSWTDLIYAKELGYSVYTVRNIRLGHRRPDDHGQGKE